MLKRWKCRVLALLFAAVMLLCSACSFNSGRTVTQYVNTVREDTRQIVNLSREIRKQREDLDPAKKADTDRLTASLDELADLYTELLTIEVPDRYDDLHAELKPCAEKAVVGISQMQDLLDHAAMTGSSDLFRQRYDELMEQYNDSCDELVAVSARITTRYRDD